MNDGDCDDHHQKFAPKMHPDRMNPGGHLPEHKRAAAHPAKHTKGKMPSQLNPDMGPHK